MTGRDPATRAEWQEAADAAALMLAVDSAEKYGLVAWLDEAGARRPGDVDVGRCEEVLERAAAMGIQAAPLTVLLRGAFGPAR